MNLKSSAKILGAAAVFLSCAQAQARISLLSPWSLSERLETRQHGIDQSFGFRSGINGVSPSGGDRDADYLVFPYALTYGVQPKFEVGAGWGLHWLDRKGKNSQFGVSDMTAAVRYRFFDANRVEKTPGLDIEFGLSFPTASFEKGLGTGALGVLFGWGLVLPLDPMRAHFGMGYRLNTENSDDVKVGGVFSYNGGASLPLKALRRDVVLMGELKGFNHARNRKADKDISSAADELYLAPGAMWNFHPGFKLYGSFLIGLTSDSSDLGTQIELQW